MVPGLFRHRSGGSRRGRVLRAKHAEVRADSDLLAAGIPTLVAFVSQRDQEFARRKGMGARNHLVLPRRAETQDSVYWTPPRARRRSVSHSTDTARRH